MVALVGNHVPVLGNTVLHFASTLQALKQGPRPFGGDDGDPQTDCPDGPTEPQPELHHNSVCIEQPRLMRSVAERLIENVTSSSDYHT